MDNCIDPRDDRADWDDLLVDTTLRRYRCSENARRLDTQQKIVGFQPPHAPLNDQGALSAPLRETQRAIDESRAKRLSGELPTFAASVQCSNPRMIQAFNAAHYRYMDLIETLDGLARYRHVVGVHDAMNEADEQPPCYQRCLARDHQVGECAVPVSGVNRLWVMPRDDVISEAPDRIQIPVRREELEGADTDVARRDAGQYRAGQWRLAPNSYRQKAPYKGLCADSGEAEGDYLTTNQ